MQLRQEILVTVAAKELCPRGKGEELHEFQFCCWCSYQLWSPKNKKLNSQSMHRRKEQSHSLYSAPWGNRAPLPGWYRTMPASQNSPTSYHWDNYSFLTCESLKSGATSLRRLNQQEECCDFMTPKGYSGYGAARRQVMCSQCPRGHKVSQLQLALHLSVRHATFPSFTNCRASSYAATGLERWNGISSNGRESKSCRGNKRRGKNKMSSLNICKYTRDRTQARWAFFRESPAGKVCQ